MAAAMVVPTLRGGEAGALDSNRFFKWETPLGGADDGGVGGPMPRLVAARRQRSRPLRPARRCENLLG